MNANQSMIQEEDSPAQVILSLSEVSKIYPGTVALRKVNIEILRGEVHGLIGKNGAGKSTLVGIIAGIVTPTEGEILLDGKKFADYSRIGSKKKKIAIVPQEPQVVADATVAENLFMPDYYCRGISIDWARIFAEAEKIVKQAGLNINVQAKASDLSVSEQQLLLVLKACYVEKARIVILDEASASLSQSDEKLLYQIIQERKKQGTTILYISHRTDELLKVCDRVTVIRDGRSICTEDVSTLNKEKLASLIVGEEFQVSCGQRLSCLEGPETQEFLAVDGLTKYGAYSKISFIVRKGEILGFAGLRGSGRTELFKGIAGIDPPDEGSISVENVKKHIASPSQAFKNGIAYLPEDREKEGLISVLSVGENLVINSLKNIKGKLFLNRAKEQSFVNELVKTFEVKTASTDQEVSQLSGGNKQKVVVGRIAAGQPKIYLLDEPTRGVDIAAKDSILKIVSEKISRDSAVIISSPGLEDLILICDRILVLHNGQIIREFQREQFNENELYQAIQGE